MEIKTIRLFALRKINLGSETDESSVPTLHCGKINIVIGPNGGGKTTLIDLIRSFGDASVLSSMPRENMLSTTVAGFDVVFDCGEGIRARFNCLGVDVFGVVIQSIDQSKSPKYFKGELSKFSKDCPAEIEEVIKHLPTQIHYRASYDNADISIDQYIAVLNENADNLNGLSPFPLDKDQNAYRRPGFRSQYFLDNPLIKNDGDFLHVSFNDDESQTNNLPMDLFPSGWKAFGGLVGWLKQHRDCICLIEEPEVHLHPKLQRQLINQITQISSQQNIQIFMTTHSPVFINSSCNLQENIKLFEADGYRIRELTESAKTLSRLGVKPSDCFQANGIIWVEGPSDRIYILHWLMLFCKEVGLSMPIENVDFSFILYGGAILKHYALKEANERNLIDMLKINANCIVVMDRDFDFDLAGNPRNGAGKNIKSEINASIGAEENKLSWVTAGYTIENYLPDKFFSQYFENSSGRVIQKSGQTKVMIAELFSEEYKAFHDSYVESSDLARWIASIVDMIIKWKS